MFRQKGKKSFIEPMANIQIAERGSSLTNALYLTATSKDDLNPPPPITLSEYYI